MLTLENVSYRYAGARRAALREVDLTLRDGEVVGLVGPSEAGKSTLCLVVSGLAPRTVGGTLSGRLLVDGGDMAGHPMHELATLVGIGFQNSATQLSGVAGTVYEEVAFGPMNLGRLRAEVIGQTEAALAALHIEQLADRDPARLSGGQQQLVAIASLLAVSPRHLILDEPTAQLDPAGTRLVSIAIEQLAATGRTILLVEHKTDLIARVCSRVIALAGGRMVSDGPTEQVLGAPALRDLGVAEPSGVRLLRTAREAGVATRALEEAILASAPGPHRP
jgi:energy-coupling factor transport system ATP-binding protein